MYKLKEDLKIPCFQCKKKIVVKYNYPQKRYSQQNLWFYWTEKEQDKEKYICNECLKKLYENKREYWKLVDNEKKRMRMRSYIYSLNKK